MTPATKIAFLRFLVHAWDGEEVAWVGEGEEGGLVGSAQSASTALARCSQIESV